jgi:hypothetical protein
MKKLAQLLTGLQWLTTLRSACDNFARQWRWPLSPVYPFNKLASTAAGPGACPAFRFSYLRNEDRLVRS